METFEAFLNTINVPEHKYRLEMILSEVKRQFPTLEYVVKWNQPMFVAHGTYIIGFSVAKAHLAIAPERACKEAFQDRIKAVGYQTTKELVKIKWSESVDLQLIFDMVRYNVEDKDALTRFWR